MKFSCLWPEGEKAPAVEVSARILVYSKDGGPGKLAIKTTTGKVLREMAVDLKPGLNDLSWDLKAEGQKERVAAGEYQVEVSLGQETQARRLRLVAASLRYMEFEVDD